LSDVIELNNQFYILATSSRVDDRTRVLKHGDTFAVFDRFGDVAPVGMGELGIYHEGTRFLSRLGLNLAGDRPLLLSSTLREDNSLLRVDLTNPDVPENGHLAVPRGTVHLLREGLLWQGVFYETLRLANYGRLPVEIPVGMVLDADFVDLFEVRGTRRQARGRRLPDECGPGFLVLGYEGLDRVRRRTRIECSPAPQQLGPRELRFRPRLEPGERITLEIAVTCEIGDHRPRRLAHQAASDAAARRFRAEHRDDCDVCSSNKQFDEWVTRSSADLIMMMSETRHGLYPYAGVPWFSTIFGRDGLITALEMLWVNDRVARGVLQYLAAHQASEVDPVRDAEPGKILHEVRTGEMAALGEVPFGRYYGSVDATPLFVVLVGEYVEHGGDREFLEAMWPHVERALEWMDTHGDPDRDGFIEYHRRSQTGLVHQGWKDSGDAVFREDGSPVEEMVALCEVQAYAFAARRHAARLAGRLGLEARATQLERQALSLQEAFERAFWCDDIGTYALALDAQKRPCRVITSNAGQCLAFGIATPPHAQRVAETLFSGRAFSGWGVRTVTEGEARYNPMSYHNGSVWPHDNALVARGLARYGHVQAALRIFGGLFDASGFVEMHRLPELFCGFERRHEEGPTLYPVACNPQAWASGAVYMLLQACLGLCVQADPPRVTFRHPTLPSYLEEITLRGLCVGGDSVDLLLSRRGDDVAVNVLARTGPIEVMVLK
jgi:glycogen debranching enzyme